jgi:hypothetical protein
MAAEKDVVEVTTCTSDLTAGFPAPSAHVVRLSATAIACCSPSSALLHERFGIQHTTLQMIEALVRGPDPGGGPAGSIPAAPLTSE